MRINDLTTIREQRGKLSVLDFFSEHLHLSVCGLKIFFGEHFFHKKDDFAMLLFPVQGEIFSSSFSITSNRYCLLDKEEMDDIRSSSEAIFVQILLENDLERNNSTIHPSPETCLTFFEKDNIVDLYPLLKKLNFDVRRLFYVYDVPLDEIRGQHKHVKCSEILIALNGSLVVATRTNNKTNTFDLSSRNQGLLIPAGVWAKQFNFQEKTICFVVANDKYDLSGYSESI